MTYTSCIFRPEFISLRHHKRHRHVRVAVKLIELAQTRQTTMIPFVLHHVLYKAHSLQFVDRLPRQSHPSFPRFRKRDVALPSRCPHRDCGQSSSSDGTTNATGTKRSPFFSLYVFRASTAHSLAWPFARPLQVRGGGNLRLRAIIRCYSSTLLGGGDERGHSFSVAPWKMRNIARVCVIGRRS